MRWCTKTDKYQVCTSGANKDNDNDKIAWVMSRRVCGVMTKTKTKTNKQSQANRDNTNDKETHHVIEIVWVMSRHVCGHSPTKTFSHLWI